MSRDSKGSTGGREDANAKRPDQQARPTTVNGSQCPSDEYGSSVRALQQDEESSTTQPVDNRPSQPSSVVEGPNESEPVLPEATTTTVENPTKQQKHDTENPTKQQKHAMRYQPWNNDELVTMSGLTTIPLDHPVEDDDFCQRIATPLVTLPPSIRSNRRRVSHQKPAHSAPNRLGWSFWRKSSSRSLPPPPPPGPTVSGASATGGASTLTGLQTIRMPRLPPPSAMPMDASESTMEDTSTSNSHVADLETQQVMPNAKNNSAFFKPQGTALTECMAYETDFDINNEVGMLGGAWRGALRRLLVRTCDDVNGLRLGRALQLQLFFLTGYEAYVTSQVIEALDNAGCPYDDQQLEWILTIAFSNRNVSRVIVQNLGPRFDFLWHWSTALEWNRLFDAWGQLPVVGITRFPATENFPSTRNHALASIFRVLLGQGNWMTRVVTRGREGLITDDPNNTAQNLAAESNGFELANRNQYGTYFGRRKTNEFRFQHRLPTDESLVRTFVAQPMPTMTNNGVVHVLRQLANHWENMLYQPWGNFAHQRMEQLDPFETLRFHMPEVLLLLSSLRGRNQWDRQVLAPMIVKLQTLKPAFDASAAKQLVRELQEDIVVHVCGGVASFVDPFQRWLQAIGKSSDEIEKQARSVYEIVTSVEVGIRLGHDLMTQVSWKIPSDAELKQAILNHIRGESTGSISQRRVQSALHLSTPRDKRTLIELVKSKLGHTKPAKLLLGRVKTLLQRELRREILNEAIRELSVGSQVYGELVHDEWYWLQENGKKAVHIYDQKISGSRHRFIHVESGFERVVSLKKDRVQVFTYVPCAEAISRAQKAFMTIELDYGKTFKYSAFMEFSYLRIALRRLAVVSQMTCEELDNARLNILREIQRSNRMQVLPEDLVPGTAYYLDNPETMKCERFVYKSDQGPEWERLQSGRILKMPPQSIVMVGGGPTGLMTCIHTTETCLTTGGVMKLYEARDAFEKGGSTFERAQIVRLDARWIAMLRYHLGTGFEDVYIPASGETDSQLGNTLPTQGFVEITIKDLENMLHTEVCRLWSKGVIKVFTDSRAMYDESENSLTKLGENLKVDDLILRRLDADGKLCNDYHSWKVVELVYTKSLSIDDLKVGEEYGVYLRQEQAVLPFKLVAVDLDNKTYTFQSLSEGIDHLKTNVKSLPSVYPSGTDSHAHADVHKIVLECVEKGSRGGYVRDELLMKTIQREKFTLDIGHTHVIEAIGKPHDSKVHFCVTTMEPYAVCCMQGLKVSLGMHNFGEKRWGSGILDDIRSQNDQNTRIIGDFTKMVRSVPITRRMFETASNDSDWEHHFNMLVDSSFPELNDYYPVFPKIVGGCKWLAEHSEQFARQTLQTRFFETGDNYYLGMELPREYDRWKKELAGSLVAPLLIKGTPARKNKEVDKLKDSLMHTIDRLWYDGCLETIREGDVYNPGAKRRVPRLYLINSYTDTDLGTLPVGESFRLSDSSEDKFEVLVKTSTDVVVRNVEGFVSRMSKSTQVKREGNLTRSPDGNQESKVALATFPVGHYVNFRSMRVSDKEKGYVFAFTGDEQATPHFMRYSGLTGACINAMSFNNFMLQAIEGVPFIDRFRRYSQETNWSNGEVVQRGTGANYGEDGFLRPGFSCKDFMNYLHSKVIEYRESEQELDCVLSRDWLNKVAASLVPRGMEINGDFIKALHAKLQKAVFEKLLKEVAADSQLVGIIDLLRARRMVIKRNRENPEKYWDRFLRGLDVDDHTKEILSDPHIFIAKSLEKICKQVTDFAAMSYLYNRRVSSELFNQPKPVDSVVDDFAVEAQNFANSLTLSAAFASGALAFALVNRSVADFVSTLLGFLNIAISFSTMTNVARYKIRNEEARIAFMDEKFDHVKKAVFSLMDRKTQDAVPMSQNPFVVSLDRNAESFRQKAKYYDYPEPKEFDDAFTTLKENINDADEIRAFQKALTSRFIAGTYQVNSYVQQSLVEMYRTADDMHHLLTQSCEKTSLGTADAKSLFDRLNAFESPLEKSLQRGPVRWGFIKQRKFWHWDVMVTLRYFWSLLFCSSRNRLNFLAPIQTETLGLLKQTRDLSTTNHSKVLGREIRDVETLYWATRESDIASLIFLSVSCVFIASILFSIARLASIPRLEDFAYWATAPSALGAVLASLHFVRKFFILCGLWSVLGRKMRKTKSSDDRLDLRKIRGVTFTQILLTLARFVAAGLAAVALPFSVAENGFGDRIETGENVPFWIAFVAVVTAVASTVFFLIVEYVVRYNLVTTLGPFVSECFREEIESIHKILTLRRNDIDTQQVQEREAWEYTAREFLHTHRFDTVFAADRFAMILQYIQSGMEARTDYV